ncbi:MAG TPA: HAD family hydrolase [Nitrososphaerales archaeon]|nr:HAD family hydrolase [Nitrososphaerales archaeon]
MKDARSPKKQILVFDYDRTLTLDDLVIPDVTKKMLELVRNKSVAILGIVSGRSLSFLESVNDNSSDSFAFLVAENGAIIRGDSGQVQVIGKEWAQRAKDLFAGSNLSVRFGEIMGATRVENARSISQFLESHDLPTSIVRNRDSLLLLPPNVGKGPGVLEAISAYGPRSEVELTSFGDGENDVSLFEPADIKVAVSNAIPELKILADVVTTQPGGLGVAEYIRNRFML